METQWFRFLGSNIRGTPPMASSSVEEDMRVVLGSADIVVLQEFKWRRYWWVLGQLFKKLAVAWSTSPRLPLGLAAPVRAAQPVLWRRSLFGRDRAKVGLLHRGRAKISESRYLRRVRLKVRGTPYKLNVWTSHFVVGGDLANDGPVRRSMMAEDLTALDVFLGGIGPAWPSLGQLDANLRVGSATYREFCRILEKHGYTIHGVHGVEFLVSRQGTKAELEVKDDWVLPTSKLFTDHEGRGLTFRLIAPSTGSRA